MCRVTLPSFFFFFFFLIGSDLWPSDAVGSLLVLPHRVAVYHGPRCGRAEIGTEWADRFPAWNVNRAGEKT